MSSFPLIDPEHKPGPLERNKDEETQEKYIKGPALSGSLNSRTFYNAAFKLIKKGNKKPLEHDDVWKLDDEHRARTIFDKIAPEWENEKKQPAPSLRRVLLTVFKKDFLGALILLFAYGCLSFINPIILPFLIIYVNDYNVPTYAGFIYIFCIILAQLVGSFCYYLGQFKGAIVGLDVRSAMVTLVYRKALTMAPRKDANTGQVVNFISSDAFFLADTISLFIVGVVGPIQIIVAIILLAIYVSFYVVITAGILVITLPLAAMIGKRFGIFRGQIQAQGDKRLKLTNELLQGIRIVKYYAWEHAFQANIESYRVKELDRVKALSLNRSALIFMMQNATTVALGVTLVLYGFYGAGGVTQANAFTLVAILNLVRQAFVLLPVSISFVQQYMNSFNRVQGFILQPDIAPVDELPEPGIKIENGNFRWAGAQETTLKNININAKKGELIMVVGPVGSGKSSIISSVLGEITKESGTAAVGGSIAYVAQEAYIFNSSVRENIIFGKPFDDVKYRKVLEASALMSDLAQFVAGDRTEIGERGVNLSGGQKQRVAIARALYSDADVILLDDPLSAVDAHVGKHLFKKAVRGMLTDRLVVLATNQLQYLPFADKVLFLSGGEVVAEGTFHDLIKSSKAFAEQMEKYGVTGEKVEEEDTDEEKRYNDAPKKDVSQNFSKPEVKDHVINGPSNGVGAFKKEKKSKRSKKDKPVEEAKPADKAQLIQSEGKQTGLVEFSVYWYYFKKGGLFSFAVMILFFAFSVGARVTGSWWLTVWTTGGTNSGIFLPLWQYIAIYSAFIGGEIIFSFGAMFMSVDFSIRASKSLHSGLLSRVIRAPTAFYDVTPLGRVINRFAKELDLIDAVLPIQFNQLLNAVFSLLGVFAAMAFATPYMLIAVAVVVVGYYFFQEFYRKAYVEIQRMEALSRAPIFSQLGETLRGAATIRAYRMEENFRNVNLNIVDNNSTHRYAQKYLLAWFGLRLDALGSVLMMALFLLIVCFRVTAADLLVGGFAALALSNTAGLTPLLSTLSLNSAETEAKLNSVERIKEYDTLEQEAPEVIESNRPPKDWPNRGEVVFKDACLRYRKGDLVLKNINVNVEGEEKVGIVGRTGAGKSTMLQALFRIVELSSGSIEIDGIDISTIGLRDLRSKISIIPQEPVLFLGTIRYNLDPFGEHSDNDLWEALAMVNLKSVVEGLAGMLESTVEENGSNFSVGQRQLICMARALLKKTKILVMDEATASVDLDTDMLIQSMVRKNFADRTSLTIAHRLNTVMDSTKIMVLNRGELAEYDKPAALLERPETIFSSMVEATGPEQSAHLRRIANGEIGVVQSLQSLKEELSERDKSANEDSISEEVVRALKEKKKSPKSSAKSSKSSSKSTKSASKSSKSSSSSSSSESSSESS